MLATSLQFYKITKVILAPNPDLVEMLLEGTGKSCFLMRHDIDSTVFSPSCRTRPVNNRTVVLGYVDRFADQLVSPTFLKMGAFRSSTANFPPDNAPRTKAVAQTASSAGCPGR